MGRWEEQLGGCEEGEAAKEGGSGLTNQLNGFIFH